MSQNQRAQSQQQLASEWEKLDTEELVTIWKKNDRTQYTDDAFVIIGDLLASRIMLLPPQEEPLWEYTQMNLPNFWDRVKIQALDQKVVVTSKNLLREYTEEYEYSELRPKVIRGKTGESEWTNLGWIVLILFLISSLTLGNLINFSVNRILILVLGCFAVITFSLRLVKYDYVWFYTDKNEFAFSMKLSGPNRELGEDIIKYITGKISQAHSLGRPQ
ncbi:MAG: hypothetical protein HY868_03335 [Chloroflexi bacterium]|nr:hypothetical protein [Chloroflexota bacterium]